MKSITSAWMAPAHDDLVLIHEIANNQILTHLMAFHGQQAIKKSFKAVLEECGENVPKMHALETLLPKVLRHPKIDFSLDLLEDLNKLYIDARHPRDFGLLPSGKPTRGRSQIVSRSGGTDSPDNSAVLRPQARVKYHVHGD